MSLVKAKQTLKHLDIPQVIACAKETISDKEKWAQGNLAFTKNDAVVSPVSKLAVKWCAVGALHLCLKKQIPECTYHTRSELIHPILAYFNRVHSPGEGSLLSTNDYGTHEEVLSLFDRAFTLAQTEQEERESISDV